MSFIIDAAPWLISTNSNETTDASPELDGISELRIDDNVEKPAAKKETEHKKPLIDHLCQIYECSIPELQIMLGNVADRRKILTHLQEGNFQLETSHLKPAGRNFQIHCSGFTAQSARYVHAFGGYLDVSVRQYYYVRHRLSLKYPFLPCIVEKTMNHRSFFPMEVVRVCFTIMNSLTIEKFLSRNTVTKQTYVGCYPADKIPKLSFFPHCMVVNTDPSQKDGTHWVAVYVVSADQVEYYDSFGVWPSISTLIDDFLHIFTRRLYSSEILQSPLSSSCGKHAVYFIYRRCQVDGQWSPWSPWQGACPSLHHTSPTFDCQLLAEQLAQPVNSPIQPLLPQQRRTRVCNNPAPLNDGAYCVGQDEQFRLCEHTCIINGGWSAWSTWSECNSQCQRLRNRECTAPAPVNGDSKTGGGHIPSHCLPTTQMDNYAQPRVVDATAGVSHQQLYVLASMGCVAFLLLVIAGLIAALLCRQKKGARKGCAKAMAISPAGSGGIFMEEKGEKLYFPVGVHDDELQHVRTVLLSQHQQRALLCDYSSANYPAKAMLTRASTPKFYTMTSTSNGGAGGSSAIHHTTSYTNNNNSYTTRSGKSYGTNSNGYTANRRMAGSRTALIPEYSSSNASSGSGHLTPSSKMVVLGRGAVGGGDELFSPENESNYATLYDSVLSANDSSAGLESGCSEKLADGVPSSLQTCTAELEEDEEFSGPGEGFCSNSTSNEPINLLLTEEEERQLQQQQHEQNAATIVAAQVDGECSRIELKRSGVALSIGEGTFSEQRTIFLAVSDNTTDRQALTDKETWLSSVIVCAPCSHQPQPARASPCKQAAEHSFEEEDSLRRPVVLSFEHCASLFPKDNWQFLVYEQALGDPTQPCEIVCRLGEENINTPVYVQLERQRCHLMTDHFGRFLLAGRPKRPNVAAQKRVHLAAYCSVVSQEISSIRVYCVPEMFIAVETVRQQEDEHRGVLLAEAEGFLVRPTGSLCCCLEDICEGYVLEQGSSQYLEIPDEHHQWCAQNGLHFSLNLKPVTTTTKSHEETDEEASPLLSGRIVIYQKGNPSERQILSFKLQRSELTRSRRRCSSSLSFPYPSLSQTNLSPLGEEMEEKHVSTQFQLSGNVKRMLSNLLDCNPLSAAARPSSTFNNPPNVGWTTLARKLGFDRYIQYFATHPGCSPTSLVLDLWEACVGNSERALLDLLQTLRVMGRADAVLVLEKYLAGGFGFDGPMPPPPSNSLNSLAANSNHAIKSLIQ
uniref:Netrin receptor UNC5 n=1 Tax=Ditylenchus dipsaci TaxID=166011 RepID=A0A915CLR9_9BILA